MTITRRVRLVLAVLPWEFYESIIETPDILGDRRSSRHCESHEDLERRRLVANAEAKKRPGV